MINTISQSSQTCQTPPKYQRSFVPHYVRLFPYQSKSKGSSVTGCTSFGSNTKSLPTGSPLSSVYVSMSIYFYSLQNATMSAPIASKTPRNFSNSPMLNLLPKLPCNLFRNVAGNISQRLANSFIFNLCFSTNSTKVISKCNKRYLIIQKHYCKIFLANRGTKSKG